MFDSSRAGLNKASLRCLTHPELDSDRNFLQVFVHFSDRLFMFVTFSGASKLSEFDNVIIEGGRINDV